MWQYKCISTTGIHWYIISTNDVLSDTLQIIGDTISYLRYDGDAQFDVEYDYRISENVNCVPFTERFDNELSGFVADIRISTTFNRSACTNEI